MKTYTILKPVLLLMLLFTSLMACKSDDPVAPAIVGTWTGTYLKTNDANPYLFKFVIRADKTLDILDDQANPGFVTGTGTWTLTGTTFEATLKYQGENTDFIWVATLDQNAGKLNAGEYGISPAKSGAGTWTLTKQP